MAVNSMDRTGHLDTVTYGHWLTRSGSTQPCFQEWLLCIAVYSIECFELLIRMSRFHRQEPGNIGSKGIHSLPNASHYVLYSKKSQQRE